MDCFSFVDKRPDFIVIHGINVDMFEIGNIFKLAVKYIFDGVLPEIGPYFIQILIDVNRNFDDIIAAGGVEISVKIDNAGER